MKPLAILWLRAVAALAAAALIVGALQQLCESSGIPVAGVWSTQ